MRCGTAEVSVTQSSDGSANSQLIGAFDGIADSCGLSPAALEGFFAESNHRRGDYIRWSSEEELTLVNERNVPQYGECYFRDFARVGDWMDVSTKVRWYCYDANAGICCPCSRIVFSPHLFVGAVGIAAISEPSLRTFQLVLFFALPTAIVLSILTVRRELAQSLRPRLLGFALSLTFVASWLWSHFDGDFALLDVRDTVLWRDVIFIALLGYLLVSVLAHAVEVFARYCRDKKGTG